MSSPLRNPLFVVFIVCTRTHVCARGTYIHVVRTSTHVLCSLAELKMEPDTRRGKKKPAKAASPNKTRATKKGAKGANKVAVVVHDEPEPAAVVIADPWLGLR